MLIGVYVDDCLAVCNEGYNTKLIVDLNKNGFNLKVENCLKDLLTNCFIKSKHFNQIMILQTHLIKKLLDKLVDEVLRMRVYRTLGAPRLTWFAKTRIRNLLMRNYKAVGLVCFSI
jgi:hypothetical protein